MVGTPDNAEWSFGSPGACSRTVCVQALSRGFLLHFGPGLWSNVPTFPTRLRPSDSSARPISPKNHGVRSIHAHRHTIHRGSLASTRVAPIPVRLRWLCGVVDPPRPYSGWHEIILPNEPTDEYFRLAYNGAFTRPAYDPQPFSWCAPGVRSA